MFRALNCIENTNHYIAIKASFIFFLLKMIDLRIYTSVHVNLKMKYNMRSREGRRGGEPLFFELM